MGCSDHQLESALSEPTGDERHATEHGRRDVVLHELRIESFFPADEATRTVMNRLADEAL